MAIDPNIVLGLKPPTAAVAASPLEDYSKGLTLRALIGQNQLQQLQVQQAQQTLADDARYRQIVGDHFGNGGAAASPSVAATGVQPGTVAAPATAPAVASPNGIPVAPDAISVKGAPVAAPSATLDALIPKLQAAGLHTQAATLQKQVDEHNKSKAGTEKDIAETGKTRTEQEVKALEYSSSALADVAKMPPERQQAGYETALAISEKLLPGSAANLRKIMPTYNPQQAGQLVSAGITHAQQLTNEMETRRTIETERNNREQNQSSRISAGAAASQASTAAKRLELEKTQVLPDNAGVVDRTTGKVTPLVSALDGKVIPAGEKPPSGYRRVPGTDKLEFIPGGPADPDTKMGTMGNREAVQVSRVLGGANQAMNDLKNVVQMPLTASSGFFGGRKQGPGLFDAGREVLANKMTSQEAQSYNVLSAGFQRSLAAIEAMGLMPNGTLTHQMDAVVFKEGDSQLTKLQKFAQTRQIVDAGLETIMSNPRMPEAQKEEARRIRTELNNAVPFTQTDLIKLQNAQLENPNATLKDVQAANPSLAAKPAAASVPTATGPGGKKLQLVNGKWIPL